MALVNDEALKDECECHYLLAPYISPNSYIMKNVLVTVFCWITMNRNSLLLSQKQQTHIVYVLYCVVYNTVCTYIASIKKC